MNSINETQQFIKALEKGERRAAFRNSQGVWEVDTQVKEGILSIFKSSPNINIEGGFVDKEALIPQKFSVSDNIRMVPFGSAVRAGAHIAEGVVIMPPSYINVGAYVGKKTMVDSHVLVGSCAQIGANVHLSAGVQIGGVLEPIGSAPCIIEDNVFVGAGCMVTEGILIRTGAVIAAGVVLAKSVPIMDTVYDKKYYGEIPENAVVIPGTRAFKDGININCAVIVKYRDEKTNQAVALEEALR